MVGGYIYIHENKMGAKLWIIFLQKVVNVQWKTFEKEAIPNHNTSKLGIQGFAQITISGNKLKLFVEILTLKNLKQCQFMMNL